MGATDWVCTTKISWTSDPIIIALAQLKKKHEKFNQKKIVNEIGLTEWDVSLP